MNQKDLGEKKISRLLPEMAFPLIIAQLVNGLYNIVDRIYLGHIEEEGAAILTGVGITYPIILLITAFSSLIGNGGGPLSAIRMGQGKKDKAEEILSTAASSLRTGCWRPETAAKTAALYFRPTSQSAQSCM